jgi:serine protease Do
VLVLDKPCGTLYATTYGFIIVNRLKDYHLVIFKSSFGKFKLLYCYQIKHLKFHKFNRSKNKKSVQKVLRKEDTMKRYNGITGGFILILVIMLVGLSCSSGVAAQEDTLMVPANFSQLAQKAKPGVVNIRAVKTVKGGGRVFRHFYGNPFGNEGHPFEDFFAPFFENGPRREFKQRSLGSGIIIDKKGFIVTNNHVIEGADEISVSLSNNKEFDAEVIGRDRNTDLALIKIKDAKKLTPLTMGNSDKINVGSWVIAIGSPFGLEQTVTAGIVSAKGRVIDAGPYNDFIQTDASINPGNSGGPLLNLAGEVVGINTAIIPSGQGIGFAIPINMAKGIVAQLKEGGEVSRGWLGVGIQDLTEELADYYGIKGQNGVLVTQVFQGDPADKAGILPNDIITAVNGKKVKTGRELSKIVANTPVGEKAKIDYIRDGKRKSLRVVLSKRTDEKEQVGLGVPNEKGDVIGLMVHDLTPDIAGRFGLDEEESGVLVVRVKTGSRADKAGIMHGDIIKEVNRKIVNNVAEYNKIMNKINSKKEISMLIKRRNQTFIAIKIKP